MLFQSKNYLESISTSETFLAYLTVGKQLPTYAVRIYLILKSKFDITLI